MVNKKGYIRTIEAIIALVLIFTVIITILPKKDISNKTPDDIDLTSSVILNEIQNNNLLRNDVITMIITTENNNGKDSSEKNVYQEIIEGAITPIIPSSIECKLMVCKITDTNTICYSNPDPLVLPEKSVYTKSILINSNSEDRLVKLFLWRKV